MKLPRKTQSPRERVHENSKSYTAFGLVLNYLQRIGQFPLSVIEIIMAASLQAK